MINNNTHKHTVFGIRLDLMVCLFLGLITLAVYWQVRDHEFINYDDPLYVTKNHHIKSGLTLKTIVWSFTAEVAANWHPITLLSHMLDVQLFGMNPGSHHLTNLFFHMANTLLLFLVLRRMTGALWQSAFVAALFAVHPLHVESVAWVAERKEVLSTFFWILTMWGYVRYVEHPGVKRYVLVVAFFMLGLMAKPMLVTLPFVLLLLDYWPLKRFQFGQSGGGRLVLEKMPLFTLSAATSVVSYLAQQSGGAIESLSVHTVGARTANALVSYATYIIKIPWPCSLALPYPYPQNLPWWQVVGACLLLAFITFIALKAIRQRPYIAVGWSWYMGTLMPVIGLVQIGSQAMADRYTYIPLIGIFVIFSWGVPELLARWRYKRAVVAMISSVIILAMMTLAWIQARYWANSISLFEHALDATVNNVIAHNQLGTALENQNKITEAIRHYSEVLRIYPDNDKTYNNLGNALIKQGKITEAIRHYSEALRINPENDKAHNNLGFALGEHGKIAEAIRHYSEALRINPEFDSAHNNMGLALENQGKITEAIRHFSEALQINPENYKAHNNLGITLLNQGKITEAIRHFFEALQIEPGIAETHNNLGTALANQGKIADAIRHYSEALRINPEFDHAHNNLGLALTNQGKIADAIRHYSEALRINPDFYRAHNNLGNALKKQGRIDEAIKHYSEALRIKPDHVDAHYKLAGIMTKKGRIDEAIRHYLQILRINPRDAGIHNSLGIALFLRGNIEDSVAHFRQALRIKPGYVSAQINLKKILAHQKQKIKSRE